MRWAMSGARRTSSSETSFTEAADSTSIASFGPAPSVVTMRSGLSARTPSADRER
jgi:hypothetical protein